MSSSRVVIGAVVVLATLCAPRAATSYSVLAHESTIDATWDATIAPLLRARFPRLGPDDLLMARAAGIDAIGVGWGVSSRADFAGKGFPEPVADWAGLRSRTARWLSPIQLSEH